MKKKENKMWGIFRRAGMLMSGVLLISVLNVNAGETGTSLFTGTEWTASPNVFEVNREPAHTGFIPYDTREKALERKKESSSYYQLLNGEWYFEHADKPADRNQEFYKPEYDVSEWDRITVPMSWQAAGYDKAIYTNQKYPWTRAGNGGDAADLKGTAPTTFNPVGSYRRNFTVNPKMLADGREIFVSFQGVESAFYVWVNGHEVGYSEDSYTPADFNITPYLQEGENVIAVQVYRWSDGSYAEDQDFIRFSGIFRDVYLYSKDAVELFDYTITTNLDEEYTDALFKVSMDFRKLKEDAAGKYEVRAELLNEEKESVFQKNLGEISFTGAKKDQMEHLVKSVSFEQENENPVLWNAENPYLYHLVIELLKDGKTVEVSDCRVGFREVEIRDNEGFFVNGKNVILKGFNRHETSPETGRTVSRDLMVKDIQLMKQANVNMVRTSHYPNCIEWYELCDEYGMYVMDEANIEAHHYMHKIPGDDFETWGAMHIDRMNSMIQRDKNFPSVVIWSMGNESGSGSVFQRIYDFTKSEDSTRPVHYFNSRGDGSADYTDNRSTTYPTAHTEKQAGRLSLPQIGTDSDPKPYFTHEYAHSMGNSTGNLQEFVDCFEQYGKLMGGALWDWVDQSLYTEKKGGSILYLKDSGPNGLHAKYEGNLAATSTDSALSGNMLLPQHAEFDGNGSFTVSAQVKQTGENSSGYDCIAAKGNEQFTMQYLKDKKGIEFCFKSSNKWYSAEAPVPENWLNQWHRVTGVYDAQAKTLKVFIDGTKTATKTGTAASRNTNKYQVSIGINPERENREFTGSIDNVWYLSRAASDQEISNNTVTKDDTACVAWYDFNSVIGNKITDLSANGLHTEYDGVLAAGVTADDGRALNGSAELPDSEHLNLTERFTLEADVYPNADPSKDMAIIVKGNSQYGMKYIKEKECIEFFICNAADSKRTTVEAPVPDDWEENWHHMAAVFDAGAQKAKIYIDRTLAAEKEVSVSACAANTYPVTIGTNAEGIAGKFEGKIDNVHIYSRALSADEIASSERAADGAGVAVWIDFQETIEGEPEGRENDYFGYGGDWGDDTSDGNFCANGVVFPDRTVQPAYYEVKKAYQGFKITGENLSDGKITVENLLDFTNMNQFKVSWELLENNKTIQSGIFSDEEVNIPGAGKKSIPVGFEKPKTVKEGTEYLLNISVCLKDDVIWAERGFEVAMEQFIVPFEATEPADRVDTNAFQSVREEGAYLDVAGDNFTLRFDTEKGEIVSFKTGRKELLNSSPAPNYWRPRIDNGSINTKYKNPSATVSAVEIDKKESVIDITVTLTYSGLNNSVNTLNYKIYATGDIVVTSEFDSKASEMLGRVGMKMELPEGYENVTYYGRGPEENYIDRKTGSRIGVYQTTVDDMFVPYMKPQANGNRTDVRWTALTDAEGDGILVISNSPTMEFGASHYSDTELNIKAHPYEMTRSDQIYFTADLVQTGLGNGSCGPAQLPKYQVASNKTYTFSYRMSPLSGDRDNSKEAYMRKAQEVIIDLSQPLKGIKIDGRPLYEFSPETEEYTVLYLNTREKLPVVEAQTVHSSVAAVVKQAETFEDMAVISVEGLEGIKEYRIHFIRQEEIAAEDVAWKSAFVGYKTIQIDKNIYGNPLALTVDGEAKEFEHGIGIHAESEIIYDITNMGYDIFEAYIGLDRAAIKDKYAGKARFEIWVDQEKVYDSGVMEGTSEAQKVRLNIIDAKEIRLYMDPLEAEGTANANANDAGNYVNPRFLSRSAEDKGTIRIQEAPEIIQLKKGSFAEVKMAAFPKDVQIYYSAAPQEGVIKIEENKITALAEGKAQVIATLVKEGYNTETQVIPVSVYEDELSITEVLNTSAATLVGQAPNLPELVTVVYSDGSRGTSTLIWENADSSQYAKEGTFTLLGTVEGTGIKPECKVTVSSQDIISQAEERVVFAVKDQSCRLPEEIRVTMAGGSEKRASVVWEDVSSALAECGMHLIRGSIEGTDVTAYCKLIVYEEVNPVVSIRQETVTTEAKTMPLLPEKVLAVYLDGSEEEKTVVWNSFEEELYGTEGSFEVDGYIPGFGTKAVCTVQVEAAVVEIPADSTELAAAVAEAKKLDLSGYTDDSAENFRQALKRAEEAVENTDVTQDILDEALKELKRAQEMLVSKKPVSPEGPEPQPEPDPDPKPEQKPVPAEKPVKGSVFEYQGLQYRVINSDGTNRTVEVVKFLKDQKKITIPETAGKNGYTYQVISIGRQAFINNKKVKEVVIGKNITKIGAKSFYKCSKLKKITFKGIKKVKVGKKAFSGIKKTCTVTVPKKMSEKNLAKLKKNMKSAGKKIRYKKK